MPLCYFLRICQPTAIGLVVSGRSLLIQVADEPHAELGRFIAAQCVGLKRHLRLDLDLG